MKKNFVYAMAIGMFACGLSSCSSDDKNSDEPNQPSVKMVLTEMRGGYVSGNYDENVYQMKYDSQGRVTDALIYSSNWEKYVYTDNKITCGSDVYEVSNGKIINNGSKEYKYDSSNQLIGLGGSSFTWSDGNITVAADHNSWGNEKYTLTYTDKPNVGNLNMALNFAYSTCFPSEGGYFDPVLAISGYFGTPCKNLCKSISINGKLDRTFDYLDYNENGYPKTLKIIDSDGDSQIYTLIWTKL